MVIRPVDGFKATYRRRVRRPTSLAMEVLQLLYLVRSRSKETSPYQTFRKPSAASEAARANTSSIMNKVISLSTEVIEPVARAYVPEARAKIAKPKRLIPSFLFLCFDYLVYETKKFLQFSLEVKVKNPRYKAAVFPVRSIAVIDYGRLHISQKCKFHPEKVFLQCKIPVGCRGRKSCTRCELSGGVGFR